MRALTAHDILRIWERGAGRHAIDRALLMLAPIYADQSAERLAALSIGQRNVRLLRLREATLGGLMNATSTCPECGEQMEFGVNVDDVCLTPIDDGVVQEYAMTAGDVDLRFRLVNSADLAALADVQDAEIARDLLVERCLLEARIGDEVILAHELPPDAVAQLAEQMSECDPQAEIRIRLDCEKCEATWASPFDIVSFFWTEVVALAERLLSDVHMLARSYGWREADILAMSAGRRKAYLERIGG